MEDKKAQQAGDEINLIDYLIVLLKRKKIIAGLTLSCAVITAVVSLLMPNLYRAEARILPPQHGREAGMMGVLMSQFAGGGTGLGGQLGVNNQSELYVDMLQSRTVKDNIIARFELRKLFGVKTNDEARKALTKKITIEADPKSNIIVITVEDRDPQRSAAMANAFVEELRQLTKGIAVTEAAQRRLFFEEQLKDAKESLIRAEDSMKGFQEKSGALQVEEQVKAQIKNIAQLRAGVAAKEVEIRVLKTYATTNNPDLQKAEEALSGMKIEVAKLESKSGNSHDTLMPTGRMPSVGTEYVRKLRDLKFNETLYELLLKQYEAARLDEARDAAVIQVIDRAVPPEKRAKPKRTAMVMIAAAVGFLLSVGFVFFMGCWEAVSRDPENRERIEQLREYAALDDLPMAFTRKWRRIAATRKGERRAVERIEHD